MRARLAVFGLTVCLQSLTALAQNAPPPSEAFVGRFSNGVSVELIGVGMRPSSQAEWWKPDGTPLEGRPYDRFVVKHRFKSSFMEREVCFKRVGKFANEVLRSYRTLPGHVEHDGTPMDANGEVVRGIEATVFSFDTLVRTCTVRFTFTYEASPWKTLVEAQAGSSYSDFVDSVHVVFMPPCRDGNDTSLTVGYSNFGDVRVFGITKDGRKREGVCEEEVTIGEARISQLRFAETSPEQFVKWQFQKRRLREETVEFHNVSLEPGLKTEVKVVDAGDEALSVTATNPTPGDTKAAAEERIQQQQELVKALVEKHGYKLAEGEPFKYVKDPQNKERDELRRLMQSSRPAGGPTPKATLDDFALFTHVLYVVPDGRIVSSSLSEGVTTLGTVLERVLKVMPYEFECPPNLLYTYMPGDWLILEEEGRRPVISDGAALALEKALSECGLSVSVEWKMVERPALTIRGRYAPKPAGGKLKDDRETAISDGVFLVDARRALSYHPPKMDGDFDQFIESIGYLLMLPTVNEAETRPTKRLLAWREVGKPIEGNDRLKPEHEQSVLKSLASQTGYEVTIEPRGVKLLSIQPVE